MAELESLLAGLVSGLSPEAAATGTCRNLIKLLNSLDNDEDIVKLVRSFSVVEAVVCAG
jgi:hypothetical protein